MKIYVCHSTGFEYEKELYAPLRTIAGHEFVFPHETGDGAHSKDVIASCDLVIAETSYPSTGMGIELGWADAAGVPIACVHRADAKLSGAVRYVAKDLASYEGPDDLIAAVKAIVAKEA